MEYQLGILRFNISHGKTGNKNNRIVLNTFSVIGMLVCAVPLDKMRWRKLRKRFVFFSSGNSMFIAKTEKQLRKTIAKGSSKIFQILITSQQKYESHKKCIYFMGIWSDCLCYKTPTAVLINVTSNWCIKLLTLDRQRENALTAGNNLISYSIRVFFFLVFFVHFSGYRNFSSPHHTH